MPLPRAQPADDSVQSVCPRPGALEKELPWPRVRLRPNMCPRRHFDFQPRDSSESRLHQVELWVITIKLPASLLVLLQSCTLFSFMFLSHSHTASVCIFLYLMSLLWCTPASYKPPPSPQTQTQIGSMFPVLRNAGVCGYTGACACVCVAAYVSLQFVTQKEGKPFLMYLPF